jgi:hypothetical protein
VVVQQRDVSFRCELKQCRLSNATIQVSVELHFWKALHKFFKSMTTTVLVCIHQRQWRPRTALLHVDSHSTFGEFRPRGIGMLKCIHLQRRRSELACCMQRPKPGRDERSVSSSCCSRYTLTGEESCFLRTPQPTHPLSGILTDSFDSRSPCLVFACDRAHNL